MIPTVIKVYLRDEESSVVDVPITPDTTAEDVVEFCKEPGENECRLLERWRGNDRIVELGEKPFTLLQQWGSHAPEINFVLHRSYLINNHNDTNGGGDLSSSVVPGLDLEETSSLPRLKEIAHQQHQQIEQQEQNMVAKEQRLKFVKEQLKQHQVLIGENEALRRLKEKADAQEAKLKKIRLLCGKHENTQQKNAGVSNELKAVQRLFDQKKSELATAIQKVDELTSQLDELRRGSMTTPNLIATSPPNSFSLPFDINNKQDAMNNNNTTTTNSEIESIRREMGALCRVNDQQRRKLDEQRQQLRKRNDEAGELDRRIEVLTARLRQKKLTNASYQQQQQQQQQLTQQRSNNNNNQQSVVAAVEPLVKQQKSSSSLYNDAKNNNNNEITNRIDQLPPTTQHDDKTLTAKVQPIQQQQQQNFKYLNLKPQTTENTNLFVYKDPPAAATAVSNSQYLPPPPPYPVSYLDQDMNELRRKYSNAPRPLKKRSSITEAERPQQQQQIPKMLYDKLYKQADTPYYRSNSNLDKAAVPPPAYKEPTPAAPPAVARGGVGSTEAASESSSVSYESNTTPKQFLMRQQQINKSSEEKTVKENEQEASVGAEVKTAAAADSAPSSSADAVSAGEDEALPSQSSIEVSCDTVVPTKSILKKAGVVKARRNIRFDPLALLLDASLEGDFDLVKGIIGQVANSSGANDEGITALHNAVCAGHFDIVRFLVHFGSDVNAADTDGWTPLHCAASCNNLYMAKFLVENGACIFATTLSDGETAPDKCEDGEEGYDVCYGYLRGVQDKLGKVRQGQVYALFDYDASSDDELSFKDGDLLTVVRKGDDSEDRWWWSRDNDGHVGYIPHNFVGLWPRIKSKEDQV